MLPLGWAANDQAASAALTLHVFRPLGKTAARWTKPRHGATGRRPVTKSFAVRRYETVRVWSVLRADGPQVTSQCGIVVGAHLRQQDTAAQHGTACTGVNLSKPAHGNPVPVP